MAIIKRKCDNCGKEYNADTRNLRRGWGRCCCKSCAAQLREKKKERYPLSYDGADFDQWGDCEFGIHD